MTTSRNYAPPWYDTETGEYYGPETEATYNRHISNYRQWAFRKQGPERPEAKLVHEFAKDNWESMPSSEQDIYRSIFMFRNSLAEAAEDHGISRSTVRSYVKRLIARAEDWKRTLDEEKPS